MVSKFLFCFSKAASISPRLSSLLRLSMMLRRSSVRGENCEVNRGEGREICSQFILESLDLMPQDRINVSTPGILQFRPSVLEFRAGVVLQVVESNTSKERRGQLSVAILFLASVLERRRLTN